MFNTKQCIDELIGLIGASLGSYLPEGMPAPTAVTFGVVPKDGGWQSPALFLYPVSVLPVPTGQGVWESSVTLDVKAAITEETIAVADLLALSYVDALQGLFIANTGIDHVQDISPGIGTIDNETVAGSKLASVTVTCSLRAGE